MQPCDFESAHLFLDGAVAHHLRQFFLQSIDVSCYVSEDGYFLLASAFEVGVDRQVISVSSLDLERNSLVQSRAQGLVQVEIISLLEDFESGFLGRLFAFDAR